MTGLQRVTGLALALALLAQGAAADLRPVRRPAPDPVSTLAPPQDLRPTSRTAADSLPVVAGPGSLTVATSNAVARLRPQARPAVWMPVEARPAPAPAVARSVRPAPRPAIARSAEPQVPLVQAAAIRSQPSREAIVGRKGSVCGDPRVKGQVIAQITSRVRGCGVAEPVRVISVAGVRLSEAATIDCATARALSAWVEQGLQPQFGRDPVVGLHVAGHYVCRPRNNIPGGKISEHGRGRAIDISGFTLASGRTLTIAGDWRGGKAGRAIKAAHEAACGQFRTTLGPGSDGHHEDHLHFDTSARKGGAYCR